MTRKKIVQIDSLYPFFADQLQGEIISLQLKSYSSITRHILSSAYNSGHNVVPSLNPFAFESYILFDGCVEQINALCSELKLKNDISGNNIDYILHRLEPDYIYVSDLTTFDFSSFKSICSSPKIIGWHATSISKSVRFDCLDLLLSGISAIRDYASSQGCKVEKFYPGALVRPHLLQSREFDVSFVGSNFRGLHSRRTELLLKLAHDLPEVNFYYFMDGLEQQSLPRNVRLMEPVFGHQMLDVYARSKLVLDMRADFNFDSNTGLRESSNMRILEATSEGALVITEAAKNLCDLFLPDEEIITYRDYDELVERVHFFTSPHNELKRNLIASAGFQRIRASHSMARRAEDFERFLKLLSCEESGEKKPKSVCDHALVALFFNGEDHLFNGYNLSRLMKDKYIDLIIFVNYKYLPDLVDTPFFRKLNAISNIQILPVLEPSISDLANAMEQLFQNNASKLKYKDLFYISSGVLFSESDLHVAGDHLLLEINEKSNKDSLFCQAKIHFLKIDIRYYIGDGLFRDFTFAELLERLFRQHLHRKLDGITHQLSSKLSPKVALIDNKWWDLSRVPSDEGHSDGMDRAMIRQYLGELTSLNNGDLDRLQSRYQSNQLASNVEGLSITIRRNSEAGPLTIQSDGNANSTLVVGKNQSSWEDPLLVRQQHESLKALIEFGRVNGYRIDLREIVEGLGLVKNQVPGKVSVLEVGCGTGYISELIGEVYEQFSYTGVDQSTAMVNSAKELYPQHTFLTANDQNLPFRENDFSIVISGASMMHSSNPQRHLYEASRVSNFFVYINTITTTKKAKSFTFVKEAYGQPLDEWVISQEDLGTFLDLSGLIPISKKRLFDYSIEKHVGLDVNILGILCKKAKKLTLDRLKATRNYYFTYFDSNYLAKGLAMLASLQANDIKAYVYVVCMDTNCFNFLTKSDEGVFTAVGLRRDQLRFTDVSGIEQADLEYMEARNDRTLIEWYFTSTSCIANFLIDLVPAGERLTYLDADLFFYASPDDLFEEAKDSSVQIIPHRFSQKWKGLEIYGVFNVGWVSFSNSKEGRCIVKEYRRKCIEWCFDRVEDGKFGDQKYLDTWPSDFKDVCVSKIKGANVGWWNIEGTVADSLGRFKFIDESPVIFIHASGISKSPNGYHLKDNPLTYGDHYNEIYLPYIYRLNNVYNIITANGFDTKPVDIRYQTY